MRQLYYKLQQNVITDYDKKLLQIKADLISAKSKIMTNFVKFYYKIMATLSVNTNMANFITNYNRYYKLRRCYKLRRNILPLLFDKILKGFDQGLITGMILIDLQKAVDTIDHDILLQELHAIGFSKHSVNWFLINILSHKYRISSNKRRASNNLRPLISATLLCIQIEISVSIY